MNQFTRTTFLAAGASSALAASARAAGGPLLDAVNQRPYDWGTPLDELNENLYTANRTFFIRSHMGPPLQIDEGAYRLRVDGLVKTPLALSLTDLKKMPRHEVPVVLQCAGNGRAFYGDAYPTASHPAGAQWKYGGVGNARWAGVRVRDVLAAAGVDPSAKFATNEGLDDPLLATTPKFVRGIELGKIMDDDAIFAYEMNGESLPYYHGFPVRLIVPGWAGDHFVKWFSRMTLTDTLTTAFWTGTGYRYPNVLGEPGVGMPPDQMHPVTAINVKSILTSPVSGRSLSAGKPIVVSGFAWSGDGAIASKVEISLDDGKSWTEARLGVSPGKYSWRQFTLPWTPQRGSATISARATDTNGAVQPIASPWNPSGYLWNGIQRVELEVA